MLYCNSGSSRVVFLFFAMAVSVVHLGFWGHSCCRLPRLFETCMGSRTTLPPKQNIPAHLIRQCQAQSRLVKGEPLADIELVHKGCLGELIRTGMTLIT